MKAKTYSLLLFVCFGFLLSRSSRGFVILSLILLCSHHTCETFEHPNNNKKHRRVLFSFCFIHTKRKIMQACQSSSIFTARRCVLSAAKKHQMKKQQKISTIVKAQEFIATDKAPAAAGPYSQAIKVYYKFDWIDFSFCFFSFVVVISRE